MSQHVLPQNYDEIEAVIELVWGDHPELTTKGELLAACQAKILEMREP